VALRLPAVQARMAQDAIEIRHLSPDEFTKLIEAEIGRWSPLAKSLGAAGN
jgi:tripartite-type tricarboxylate transporter receptor subunit TctC